MTNPEKSGRAAEVVLSLALCHSLVIRASSLVIRVLTLAIRVYQLTISPAQIFLFGAGSGCRFTPGCSEYAMGAIHTHGAMAGGWLATKRICRCHPWGGGGHDPVPRREIGVRSSPAAAALRRGKEFGI